MISMDWLGMRKMMMQKKKRTSARCQSSSLVGGGGRYDVKMGIGGNEREMRGMAWR